MSVDGENTGATSLRRRMSGIFLLLAAAVVFIEDVVKRVYVIKVFVTKYGGFFADRIDFYHLEKLVERFGNVVNVNNFDFCLIVFLEIW